MKTAKIAGYGNIRLTVYENSLYIKILGIHLFYLPIMSNPCLGPRHMFSIFTIKTPPTLNREDADICPLTINKH